MNERLYEIAKSAPSGQKILGACESIADVLIHKNISYGNSALEYNSIFGELTAEQALYARINDKLQRIANNQSYRDEHMVDAINDLIGYLILLKILIEDSE